MTKEQQVRTATFRASTAITEMAKGAIPVAAALGINEIFPYVAKSFGIEADKLHWKDFTDVWTKIGQREGMILAGAAFGLAQNIILRQKTLAALEGKTAPGTYESIGTLADGTKRFHITCIDKRRADKSGGSVPGGYATLGAPFAKSILAAAFKHVGDDNPLANFAAGYLATNSLITSAEQNWNMIREIKKISDQNRKGKILIEVEDHWDGCGAQGMTGLSSYWAKFVGHHPKLADVIGLPNEFAGYSFFNLVYSPAVHMATKGRVHVTAVLPRTPLEHPQSHALN